MINLDNNATTHICPAALGAMCDAMHKCQGNPSSTHCLGKYSEEVLESARCHISELLGVTSPELLFTSGATESNNIVIMGVAKRYPPGICMITTEIEHPSVSNVFRDLSRSGTVQVKYVKVDKTTGLVSLKNLETLLSHNRKTVLVSIIFANHEIGTVQPIREIAAMCHSFGVPLHTDATQAIGKIPVDARRLGIDYMSFSGHKFYGPTGIGGLYMRNKCLLPSQITFGGNQESLIRPGTQNVSGAVGMAAALEDTLLHLKEITIKELRIRDLILTKFRCQMNGHPEYCLPGTLSLCFPGTDAETLVNRLSDVGICVSRGSACKAKSKQGSNVLRAIGLSDREMKGTIRVSIGRYNTLKEAHLFITTMFSYYRAIEK